MLALALRDARPSRLFAFGLVAAALVVTIPARAATYQVGPGKPYADLSELADSLQPGDIVEVDGDHTYPGDLHIKSSGTEDNKITIRGVRVNGKRPVLSGGSEYTIVLHGSHTVFEGFEVTAGQTFCIVHKADDVTVRDTVVHDCPNQGILGTDSESGSLTLEFVEVYGSGEGLSNHQLYIATDETMYPGSVFRMQHCFVHDGKGGNSVKTRSERNEIYYNWIEGGMYHELDLIGPDGQDPSLAREDSDVVGNVFRKTSEWTIARMGGDGTGATSGRYRFANNTFILAASTQNAFYMQDAIESIELSNNVFFQPGAPGAKIYDDGDAAWTSGAAVIRGSNNWVQEGLGNVPSAWSATITGADPGLFDVAQFDFQPKETSPLVDAGAATTASPPGFEFPSPLATPAFVPPLHTLNVVGMAAARQLVGTIDIGAYEFGSPVSTGSGGSTGPTGSSGAAGGIGPKAGDPGGAADDGGCGCHLPGGDGGPSRGAILAGVAALAVLARRRGIRPRSC